MAPYNNKSLNRFLITPVNALPVSAKQTPLIGSVSVVGGLFDKDHNLLNDDISTIRYGLRILREAGITTTPDPQFHFYNLLAPLKSDFLLAAHYGDDAAPVSDLLIVCGIWGGRSKMLSFDNAPRTERESVYENFRTRYSVRDDREIRISPLQVYEEKAWPVAADRIGAKIVITRGPDNKLDAVGSSHFLPGDFYRAAIPTSDKQYEISGALGGPMAFLIHKNALPDMKKDVDPRHILGKRIQRLSLA